MLPKQFKLLCITLCISLGTPPKESQKVARIRSIKPEVRRSRTVTSWPRDVRLAWVYLWCYLDDHGRGEDDLGLIKAELFPRDRDVTETKLDGWLWRMTEPVVNGVPAPLCRYTNNGLDNLHAVNWLEHQKISHPTDSRVGPCPVHELLITGEIRTPDGSIHVDLAKLSGTIPESIGKRS